MFLVLIGTKAQFIKTAPILRALDERGLAYTLVYTGQHQETFELLEATFQTRAPDEVLVGEMEAATHATFLRWAVLFWLRALGRILRRAWRGHRIAVVHGDTASTLFGALAARLAGLPVAHVEAGLRSPRLLEPFPEEIIRRIVSWLSILHLAPNPEAASNLRGASGYVVDTGGNSLRDALALAMGSYGDVPEHGGHGGYAVVSLHRNENLQREADFDLLMEEVVRATEVLPIRFVLHPATRERLKSTGWATKLEQVQGLRLLDRMDYPKFIRLLIGANFLMTDGGSNQEEAAMLGLPTLLLRRVTERPDGLGDIVEVSGLDRQKIRDFVRRFASHRWPIRVTGGSSPANKIVDALLQATSKTT